MQGCWQSSQGPVFWTWVCVGFILWQQLSFTFYSIAGVCKEGTHFPVLFTKSLELTLTSWLAHMITFNSQTGSLGYSLPFGEAWVMGLFQDIASVLLKLHGLKTNKFFQKKEGGQLKRWYHCSTGGAIVKALVSPVIGQGQKISFGALERFHFTYTWRLRYFKLKMQVWICPKFESFSFTHIYSVPHIVLLL